MGFLIDDLDDRIFKYVFQLGMISLSLIEEVGNRGAVAGAIFSKVNGLTMISKGKDGYRYSHNMFHSYLWKDTA